MSKNTGTDTFKILLQFQLRYNIIKFLTKTFHKFPDHKKSRFKIPLHFILFFIPPKTRQFFVQLPKLINEDDITPLDSTYQYLPYLIGETLTNLGYNSTN